MQLTFYLYYINFLTINNILSDVYAELWDEDAEISLNLRDIEFLMEKYIYLWWKYLSLIFNFWWWIILITNDKKYT